MLPTLGKSGSLGATAAKKSMAELKRDRESVEPHSVRPSTSYTDKNVEKKCDLVLSDRRLTIQEIADTTGISIGQAHHIIRTQLLCSKVSARWVPRLY